MDEVKEVLAHRGKGIGHVTRIMLDNMVVPLADGDVDVSMLKQAVKLVDGQVETEVMCLTYFLGIICLDCKNVLFTKSCVHLPITGHQVRQIV